MLLLVSFTSCDPQKKIDKAIAEQKDTVFSFIDTVTTACEYSTLLRSKNAEEYDLSKYNDTTEEGKAIKNLIGLLLCVSNKEEYSYFGSSNYTVDNASGTVKFAVDGDASTLTFTGVSVKAACVVSNDKTVIGELTLDGVISVKNTTSGKTEDYTTTIELKVTGLNENGTSYKDIELTFVSDDSDIIYTKAVCDGTSLDIEMLNKIYKMNKDL